MKKQDDFEIGVDSVLGLAMIVVLIGIACITYRYVPFYGATPVIVGMLVLITHAIDVWWRRRRRS